MKTNLLFRSMCFSFRKEVRILNQLNISEMKWGFALQNKLKMALLLLVVFAALLIGNLVEKRHVAELGTSFDSVYKDRLLVEGYIYELSNCLHAKKETISRVYSPGQMKTVTKELRRQDAEIDELVLAYEQTKLTEKEAAVLGSLKYRLHALDRYGQSYLERVKNGYPVTDLETNMSAAIRLASSDLGELSSIQLAVGRDMNDHSQKILSESSVLSQFAIVLLIVIGLIVQLLLFRPQEVVIKKLPDIRLN
jgi:hypothetical protein